MYELYPYFTNDGSVGLFSPQADDIYHSTYGALSEAYEKFIIPAELENYFETHNEIKVLDICYGIGYNSKSFLNFLIEKNILKINFQKNNLHENLYDESIHTNNILEQKSTSTRDSNNIHKTKSIGTIGSDNTKEYYKKDFDNVTSEKDILNSVAIHSNKVFGEKSACKPEKIKIFIKALDIDENLLFLSPFFKQGNSADKKHNKLNFHYEKINKLLSGNFEQKYKLKNEVNLIILNKLIEKMPEILKNQEIINILKSKKYRPFFAHDLRRYFEFLQNQGCKYNPLKGLLSFLHNIYYNHISISYKTHLNSFKMPDFDFEPKIGDARKSLSEDSETYNYIFLDAFTPAKCPALWSLEFFILLFNHLDDNGLILTYSSSAAIRNAMIHAGFFVGKIYNDDLNKFTGTIAVKNKSLIKHELSEYDLGLINSKAGIFYRDENLNSLNEAIIAARENEVKNSDKISSSRFIKDYKGKISGN